MIQGSILAFQMRFGGLVLDEFLSPHHQKVILTDQLHWTEKLTKFQNFDFYFNKPFVPIYNLTVFLFSMFLPLAPFSYIAVPLILVGLQYMLAESITAGGIRLFTSQYGFIKGIGLYLQRMWSLVFTFGVLIPLHDFKTRNALKGEAGLFTSGIKDMVYPMLPFKKLYDGYKISVRMGLDFLIILLFAPAHPLAIVTQWFFYLMPFVFIYGGFRGNGFKRPGVTLRHLGLSCRILCVVFSIYLNTVMVVVGCSLGINIYSCFSKSTLAKRRHKGLKSNNRILL